MGAATAVFQKHARSPDAPVEHLSLSPMSRRLGQCWLAISGLGSIIIGSLSCCSNPKARIAIATSLDRSASRAAFGLAGRIGRVLDIGSCLTLTLTLTLTLSLT